jgi:hypothetical protein
VTYSSCCCTAAISSTLQVFMHAGSYILVVLSSVCQILAGSIALCLLLSVTDVTGTAWKERMLPGSRVPR